VITRVGGFVTQTAHDAAVLAGVGQEQAHDDAGREGAAWPALRARRRWAELLRLVFQVDVTVRPSCGGPMRIIAFVTEHAVVTRILAHLARRGVEARAGPWVVAGQARAGARCAVIEWGGRVRRPPAGGVCAASPEGCRAIASVALGGRSREALGARAGIAGGR
jgi:hypothetical protein